MPVVQRLVDDLALIIGHRVEFHIHVGTLYLLGNPAAHGSQLAVTLILVVVDINQDIDALLEFRIDGTAYYGVEGSECLAHLADENRVVVGVEVDDELAVLLFDCGFEITVNSHEEVSEIVKEEFLDVVHAVGINGYGRTDSEQAFLFFGNEVGQLFNGNVLICRCSLECFLQCFAGIVFHYLAPSFRLSMIFCTSRVFTMVTME